MPLKRSTFLVLAVALCLSVGTASADSSRIYNFIAKNKSESKDKKKKPAPWAPVVTKVGEKSYRFDLPTSKSGRRIVAVPDVRPMVPAIPAIHPPATTGSPTVGITIHTLEACREPYYLPSNRFEWWGKTPPATGDFASDFNCEFSSMLASAAGDNTSLNSNAELQAAGFRVSPWTRNDAGRSPNDIPGKAFTVRSSSPLSRPVIREYNPQNLATSPVVIVNEGDPAAIAALPAGEMRPSLWFDFQIPQRAVGLEYGYQILNDNSDHIDKRGVELIAYDANGGEIIRGYGRADVGSLTDNRRLAPTRLDHMIGVRDAKGRISRVEFRFTTDRADQQPPNQGNRILEPQVVSRVWSEPLPPAAVFQSEVGVETSLAGSGPTYAWSSGTFAERYGHEAGPMTVDLPYRFDRALVYLRGFRLEFMDSQPHAVKEIRAGISQNSTQFDLIETGTAPDIDYMPRRVYVMPQLDFDSGERPQRPFRAVAYYGILAWDSGQTDVQLSPGTDSTSGIDAELFQSMFSNDTCCGQLAGTLQNVTFSSFTPVDLEEFYFYPGIENIPGTLNRTGGHIAWSLASRFDRDPDNISYFRNTIGTVLTGAGISHGPEDFPGRDASATSGAFQGAIAYILDPTGPRNGKDDYKYDAGFVRNRMHLAWPVQGDAAIVTLHHYIFSLHEEPVQQLDFEVKGESYDGKVIDWKLGAGVNTLPLIIGSGDDRERFVFGVPSFAAVKRRDP